MTEENHIIDETIKLWSSVFSACDAWNDALNDGGILLSAIESTANLYAQKEAVNRVNPKLDPLFMEFPELYPKLCQKLSLTLQNSKSTIIEHAEEILIYPIHHIIEQQKEIHNQIMSLLVHKDLQLKCATYPKPADILEDTGRVATMLCDVEIRSQAVLEKILDPYSKIDAEALIQKLSFSVTEQQMLMYFKAHYKN